MASMEREFIAEAAIREAESQPTWQARETIKRLEVLKECTLNEIPCPETGLVTKDAVVKEQLVEVCNAFIEMLSDRINN